VIFLYSLCCPVLNPQMTGDPLFPGEATEKESVAQSPIPAPSVNGAAEGRITVPVLGPSISNVW
jgi:hypothetical protein